MTGALAWLDHEELARRAAGPWRVPRSRSACEPVIDLAPNDYLSLARDPRVVAGAVRAARMWGAGSTGSRLVTGSTELRPPSVPVGTSRLRLSAHAALPDSDLARVARVLGTVLAGAVR